MKKHLHNIVFKVNSVYFMIGLYLDTTTAYTSLSLDTLANVLYDDKTCAKVRTGSGGSGTSSYFYYLVAPVYLYVDYPYVGASLRMSSTISSLIDIKNLFISYYGTSSLQNIQLTTSNYTFVNDIVQ